ncbi:MAG: tryptophan--tRNA ligase [Patescibacteria group bacterium]|nr:tryptophan--tRNA ligase [Patescibacteria group bacterium]
MKRILTGDRPTGPLHLGHYFGSLKNRVELQNKYETFIIVADWQVLYDHLEDEKGKAIERNIMEVVLDNLAVGLDPDKVTFFIQSEVPEICELTQIFQFLVTVARAKRNPTVKEEFLNIVSKNDLYDESEEEVKFIREWHLKFSDEDKEKVFNKGWDKMNLGFLCFPISQAADILFCKADLVPVGEDQMPHIEQTREIVRKFNRLFGDTFTEPEALVSKTPRLRGLDGQAKMSKSLGNVINLKATSGEVELAIKGAYSGENHALFEYGKLFGLNEKDFEVSGVVQMGKFKPALAEKINDFLEPIRKQRASFQKDPKFIRKLLDNGRAKAQKIAQETLKEVKQKMGMDYKFKF